MSAEFATALADAGGAGAPAPRLAQLRTLLAAELRRGAEELTCPRSGYGDRIIVGLGTRDGEIRAVLPLPAAFRADPHAAPERAWLLASATVGALVDLADAGPPEIAGLELRAGDWDDHLVLALPARAALAPADLDDFVPLVLEEHAGRIDRLRVRGLALPEGLLPPAADPPIGAGHPLRVAEAVARLGGRPADPGADETQEEAVLALIGAGPACTARPHDDPEPARRIARRILQRLDGMGKWGGYHTDFSHLPRGFAGNERALAQDVGERLLDAGLLAEKPSVGQRHVFLNPRRAADIHRMIDSGELPGDLRLPTLRH